MNIAVVGAGAMGKVLKDLIGQKEGMECAASLEPMAGQGLKDIAGKVDVIIDFSNPANLDMIYDYAKETGCGAVIATTGFSLEQVRKIRQLAESVPVVFSANFSLGITVMKKVLSEITPILKESFDIEIIEKHHNKKLDSPSGTAKLLAEAINPEGEFNQVYGRLGNGKRKKEIGIHAVRGGTIAGEHTVLFAGNDELIEIRHTANSKKIFAEGAIKAAEFAAGKAGQPGLYSMEDVLF